MPINLKLATYRHCQITNQIKPKENSSNWNEMAIELKFATYEHCQITNQRQSKRK
jgi:hypothetical protein